MKKFVMLLALVVSALFFGGASVMACQVISVEKIDKNSFQLQLDLTGLPEGSFFWKGTPAPGSSWQFAKEVENVTTVANGDIGTVTVADWPEGESIEFSYGRGKWSEDVLGWVTPTDQNCTDVQVVSGHFRLQLGVKPPVNTKNVGSMIAVYKLLLGSCHPLGATGDNMITGVEDLGSGKYRLYLNFSGLLGTPHFVGEKEPNGPWQERPVEVKGKCRVVQVTWPYQEKIHFSWYGETAQGKQSWADAENAGSKFATCIDGGGHKQFCLNPAEVVGND